jgi:formylglycine-generating enzyme required for sulfatase activity
MRLIGNYLQRTGYRLPTEAEWEYACRAGAVTSRYFGQTEDLLPRYAWYGKNSQDQTWPVSSLKPNDLGLFDMHGNVWTWCQERFKVYPRAVDDVANEDVEDDLIVNYQDRRVLRGGSFSRQASIVRSGSRLRDVPYIKNYNVGFRPARTFAP